MDDLWKNIRKGKRNIRFKQAESYSPYSECTIDGIQQLDNHITRITWNGFYRYDSIMQPLFRKKGISDKHKDWLFDIYMHYLTELEYRTGATYQDYLVRQVQDDVEAGLYGSEIQKGFSLLTDEEKYIIVHSLYRQRNTRESVERFSETLVAVLQNGIIYKNEINEKELYVYISNQQNDEDISKIHLVKKLFMPMDYDVRIFWEQHFAVMGEEQTMIIDEIELI